MKPEKDKEEEDVSEPEEDEEESVPEEDDKEDDLGNEEEY